MLNMRRQLMNMIVPQGIKELVTQRLRTGRTRLNWATSSFSGMFNQWRTSCPAAFAPLVLMLGILLLIGGTYVNTAAATTYYMAPGNSSDSNPGTSAAPWKTFTHALPLLTPGDTLILKNGKYNTTNSGYANVNCDITNSNRTGNNGENRVDGHITIKAENEREAHIEGTTGKTVFRMNYCKYWDFYGIYATNVDKDVNGGSTFYITNSKFITFKRMLFEGNNRYENSHQLSFAACENVLVEESEFYFFHRHALIFGGGTKKSVARRNYANSRGREDIPVADGGWKSEATTRGQSGVAIYPGEDNVVENNISEGQRSGVSISALGTTKGNKLYGNISLGDYYGVFPTVRSGSRLPEDLMPRDTTIENQVVINPKDYGIYARGNKNTKINNASFFGGGPNLSPKEDYQSGLKADRHDGALGDGYYSIETTNILTVNHAKYGIHTENQNEVEHQFVHGHGNGTPPDPENDWSGPGFSNTFTGDPGIGACYVWLPDGSPLKRQGTEIEGTTTDPPERHDIGANVLYRYETTIEPDGTLTTELMTDQPLWDPETGAFPHGAKIGGVNDIAGSSAFDVHKRLHVGPPPGYEGDPPPRKDWPCPFPEDYPDPGDPSTNMAPTVVMGPALQITLPASATVTAEVMDDGLPTPPGQVTTMWSQVSGPGMVTFGEDTAVTTTASFNLAGTYVLRLTANDGALEESALLTVEVLSAPPSNYTFEARKTGAPLVLDGQLEEAAWSQAHTVTFSNLARSDNTVTVHSLWDDSALYLAFTVEDSSPLETNPDPAQLYRDDGVEFYLDTGHEGTTSLDSNDYHAIVNYQNDATLAGISAETTTSTTGYVMELEIPWTTLNVSPVGGQILGLLLGNNDRDNGSSTQFDWQGLIDGGGYGNPSLWGDLVLSADPIPLPPIVNAGSDQTITLPDGASLTGTVTDDGLPSPPNVTTTWSQVSGPGTVTFGTPTAVTTTATFSEPGIYEVRLTADDGLFTTSDDLIVDVKPATFVLLVLLEGTGNGTVTSTPGAINCPTVLCNDAFNEGQLVTLTAVASSGSDFAGWSGNCVVTGPTSCEVTLTQMETVTATFTLSNTPPEVEAGSDITLTFPAPATLAGTVGDDGLPSPSNVTTTWSQVSGPGTVTFDNAQETTTTATFSEPGTYVVRLTANDGALTSFDDRTITVKPAVPHDVDGDGQADLVWWDTYTGEVAVWLGNGAAAPTTTGVIGTLDPTSWRMEGLGDLDGDGRADLIWRDPTAGSVEVWLGNGVAVPTTMGVIGSVPPAWVIKGVGDVDGDGRADLVWREVTTGEVAVWLGNGAAAPTTTALIGSAPLAWVIEGVGDVDGDGQADLVWREVSTGEVAVWLGNGAAAPTTTALIGQVLPTSWRIEGVGDLDGDGQADLAWRDTSNGNVAMWLGNGAAAPTIQKSIGNVVPTTWRIESVGDVDGDGQADLTWRNTSNGEVAVWLGNGTTGPTATAVIGSAPTTWEIHPFSDRYETVLTLQTPIPLMVDGQLTEQAWSQAHSVTFQNTPRSDNAVTVASLWDASHLYLAFTVADTLLETDTSSTQLYRDDGVEVYFDPGHEASTALDGNDFHAIVTYLDAATVGGISTATTTSATGYVMEVQIPWTTLSVTPSAGTALGVLLGNNDRDNGSSTQFDWLGLIDHGGYGNPSLWGDLVLSGQVVEDANVAPTVVMGADGTVTLPASATVTATVTDDGLPSSPGQVTTTWSQVSGPGTVTFGEATAVTTAASFDLAGTYVLRLTAHDGQLMSSGELTVTVLPPPPPLTVTVSGTGSGSVTSTPGTINCPSDSCTETFADGTAVTLTATPSSGSTFEGWSGGGCSGTGACTVSLTQAETVTATFTASPPIVIPPSQMSVVSANSDFDDRGNVLDNNDQTSWSADGGGPYEMVLALGGTYAVSEFRYLPYKTWSRCTQYDVFVSTNTTDWGSAVASGTWANTLGEKTASFAPKIGAFVRVRYTTPSSTSTKSYCLVDEHRVVGVPEGG